MRNDQRPRRWDDPGGADIKIAIHDVGWQMPKRLDHCQRRQALRLSSRTNIKCKNRFLLAERAGTGSCAVY